MQSLFPVSCLCLLFCLSCIWAQAFKSMLETVDARIHSQYAHSDLTVIRAPTPSHSFLLARPLIISTQNHIQCTTFCFQEPQRENKCRGHFQVQKITFCSQMTRENKEMRREEKDRIRACHVLKKHELCLLCLSQGQDMQRWLVLRGRINEK